MNEQLPRRRFQFGMRTLLELIAAIAFALALMGVLLSPATNNGRYQLENVRYRNADRPAIIDSRTGNWWVYDLGGQWNAMPTPPFPKE